MANTEFAEAKRAQLLGGLSTEGLDIQITPAEQLRAQTSNLQHYFGEVHDLLEGPEGILGELIHDRYNHGGRTRIYPTVRKATLQYIGLTNRVAGVVANQAGHSFDTVLYPAFGTDFIAGVSFFGEEGPHHLVTIDGKSIYSAPILRRGMDKRTVIEHIMDERITWGHQYGNMGPYQELHEFNAKLLGVALDLNLLGVPPESIEIIQETVIPASNGEDRLAITSAQFSLPDGRLIEHTHFGGVTFETSSLFSIARSRLKYEDVRGRFLLSRILDQIAASEQVLLLRKAASSETSITEPFYPLLPAGSVVVADRVSVGSDNEMRKFVDFDLPGINLVNMVDSNMMRAIRDIEGEAPYTNDPYGPTFSYGYLHRDLTSLSVYQVSRTD